MKLQPHETPTPAAIRQGDNYPDTGGGLTDVGLIRFRRHLLKGGYDGAHGTQGAAEAEAA